MNSRTIRCALLAIGLLEAAVIHFHILGVEQTPHWKWPWRNGRAWPLYPGMLVAMMPMILAIWGHTRRMNPRVTISLVFTSLTLMQVVGLLLAYRPFDPLIPAKLIEDRYCSSYWADANHLVQTGKTVPKILAEYPALLDTFHVHSREKPPGWVLFYYGLIRTCGSGHSSSTLGAILIALLTAAGTPAVYWLANTLLQDRDAAFWAAITFALVPSIVAVYPQFDSCYPAIVCILATLWVRAIRTGDTKSATAFGLTLAVGTLFAYNILVVGVFLLSIAGLELNFGPPGAGRRIRISAATATATFIAFYLALWTTTGFNPVATLSSAMSIQRTFNAFSGRDYPQTISADFFDFLFGTGRMLALIALCSLISIRQNQNQRLQFWIATLCLAQIIFVGCSGLLRGETARVWCLLVPMLAIPAGLELTRWPPRTRYAALAVMALLLLLMIQNVEFSALSIPI